MRQNLRDTLYTLFVSVICNSFMCYICIINDNLIYIVPLFCIVMQLRFIRSLIGMYLMCFCFVILNIIILFYMFIDVIRENETSRANIALRILKLRHTPSANARITFVLMMLGHWLLCVIGLVTATAMTTTSKPLSILLVSPLRSTSHHLWTMTFLKALLRRGHHVHVFSIQETTIKGTLGQNLTSDVSRKTCFFCKYIFEYFKMNLSILKLFKAICMCKSFI